MNSDDLRMAAEIGAADAEERLLRELDAEEVESLKRITLLLKEKSTRAVALLQQCYECGHRHGWEDGPTTNETLREVNDFLCQHVPWWGDRPLQEHNEDELESAPGD